MYDPYKNTQHGRSTEKGNPYQDNPYNLLPIPPPPPPPEWHMQQRTGKLWKVTIPVFLLLIGSIVGILLYPVLTTMLSPSHVSTEKPTPFVPLGINTTPTIPVTTPFYEKNLSSTNYTLFIDAFGAALARQDVASIEPHTDTLHFIIVCDFPGASNGSCDTSWPEVKRQLLDDTLRLSINQNEPLDSHPPISSYCPGLTSQDMYAFGGFDDRSSMMEATGHYGNAILLFGCVTCGSETTWAWQSVYLCPM